MLIADCRIRTSLSTCESRRHTRFNLIPPQKLYHELCTSPIHLDPRPLSPLPSPFSLHPLLPPQHSLHPHSPLSQDPRLPYLRPVPTPTLSLPPSSLPSTLPSTRTLLLLGRGEAEMLVISEMGEGRG